LKRGPGAGCLPSLSRSAALRRSRRPASAPVMRLLVSVYVCMCVCVGVCVYVCMCVCVCVCTTRASSWSTPRCTSEVSTDWCTCVQRSAVCGQAGVCFSRHFRLFIQNAIQHTTLYKH
jgi:hypothetical protein